MKQKKTATPKALAYDPAPETPTKPLCWESFFQCQRYPILRSQLLTAMMAGTVMPAARVPTASLLDVVLIATAAREVLNAEIVSDYNGLLSRTQEEWSRPDWTAKVFSSIHGNWANAILRGTRNFDAPETEYIVPMTEWYINHEAPEYFVRELTEADVTQRARDRERSARFIWQPGDVTIIPPPPKRLTQAQQNAQARKKATTKKVTR
jgi:hypothetical protein